MLNEKNPVTKNHILQDFIWWNVQNRQTRDWKQASSWLGAGGLWAEMEVIAYGQSFFFGKMKNGPKLTVVIVAQFC